MCRGLFLRDYHGFFLKMAKDTLFAVALVIHDKIFS